MNSKDIKLTNAHIMYGNALERLKELPDNSVDSIVTDPPYGLSDNKYVAKTIMEWANGNDTFIPDGKGFMGKEWDAFVPPPAIWKECFRVLKHGGHLLAFFGSRTQDLGSLSIRLAGFEIRDNIAWLYGSGFPKSLDISKAIDKQAGAKRKVVGRNVNSRENATKDNTLYESGTVGKTDYITEPATADAQKWAGWGTALKPAFEPIIVARKPISEKTVASNVLTWGTGGLNIDASRIGTEVLPEQKAGQAQIGTFERDNMVTPERTGRFPANIILDETTEELLEQQAGTSRFFYTAKASKTDRNEGLEHLQEVKTGCLTGNLIDGKRLAGNGTPINTPIRQNFHPTVKPTTLMEYLIKLATPIGGTVLDPFTGSGSTGKAALLNGFKFIGCELTEDYLPIIEGRLKFAENKYNELQNKGADTLF